MTSLERTSVSRVLAAPAAALLAALAVAVAPASAGGEPRSPRETVGQAGLLGSDLGRQAGRRAKPPAGFSGGFVYRKGRYRPLGVTFWTGVASRPSKRPRPASKPCRTTSTIAARSSVDTSTAPASRHSCGPGRPVTTIRIPAPSRPGPPASTTAARSRHLQREHPAREGPGRQDTRVSVGPRKGDRIDFPGEAMTEHSASTIRGRWWAPTSTRAATGRTTLSFGANAGSPNRAPRGRDNCGLRHQEPRPELGLRRRRRCGGGDASRLPDDKRRYTTFDAPGVPFTAPVGINDRGRIPASR